MRVEIMECHGECYVLEDIDRYGTVPKYFEAILNKYRNGGDEPKFCPKDCVIQDVLTGTEHNLVLNGKVCDEADETLEYTQILPDERASLFGEYIYIVVDVEKEVLLIAWDDVLVNTFD